MSNYYCTICGHGRSTDLREECPNPSCRRRQVFLFGYITPGQQKGLKVGGIIILSAILLVAFAVLVILLVFGSQIQDVVTMSLTHTISMM